MTDQIARSTGTLDHTYWLKLGGDAGMAAFEADVTATAMARAAHLGITRPHVQTMWNLHVICGFTEYPMYLCGPDAPRIRTASDVFKHVWHLDNPHARFTVTIYCQDDLDRRDVEWMAKLVADARTIGLDALQKRDNWAPEVMERVKAAMAECAVPPKRLDTDDQGE